MRKILDIALPEAYRKKFFGVNWNTYEQLFLKTIDTLLRLEPEIKAEAAKAKSDKELAEKVHGTKGTKRNNNGTPKVFDANKMTCKTCGKQHKGECWAKKGNSGRNNCNGKPSFKKNQMKFINQLLKSHVAKAEESDSESASSSADWKKASTAVNKCTLLNNSEQTMYWTLKKTSTPLTMTN